MGTHCSRGDVLQEQEVNHVKGKVTDELGCLNDKLHVVRVHLDLMETTPIQSLKHAVLSN